MNKMHNPKDKKYRPINDYTQTNEIYTNADNSSNNGNCSNSGNNGNNGNSNSNINDINLFRNKIDELFT
jgi:archaellum component FlaC